MRQGATQQVQESGPGRRRAWLWAALAGAVVFLLVNHRLLLGSAAPVGEAASRYAPYQMLLADHARAGRLLSWNPWTNAGSPDFADPRTGAFSPLAILVGLLTGGSAGGFVVYWLLIWASGGFGLFILAHRFGAPPWAALLATLGYLFCGAYVGGAGHTPYLVSMSFLPLLIWRLDAAYDRRRWRPVFEAAALWGLGGLAGEPLMTMTQPLFGLAWLLGRWGGDLPICRPNLAPHEHAVPVKKNLPGVEISRFRSSPLNRLLWIVFTLLTVLVVGAVVMSPSYLAYFFEAPGFEMLGLAHSRAEAVGDGALHPGALLTLASPYLAALKAQHPELWSYTALAHSSVHLGAAVTLLAVLAVALGWRDPWRWWLVLMFAVSLMLALGRVFPLRGWLYDLLPTSRLFKEAAMFSGYGMFIASVLAALGGAELERRWESGADPRGPAGILPGVAAVTLSLAAVAGFYAVVTEVGDTGPNRWLSQGVLWLSWGTIVGAGLLWTLGRNKAATGLLVALAVAEPVATCALSPTLWTTDTEALQRRALVGAAHVSSIDLFESGLERGAEVVRQHGASANDNLALKAAVLRGEAPLVNAYHQRWVEKPVLVQSATQAGGEAGQMRPRIWYAPTAPSVVPSPELFEALAARSAALERPVIVIHNRASMLLTARAESGKAVDEEALTQIQAAEPATRVQTRLVRYTPTALWIEVRCPADGWLLVTDRWARGWRAQVNNAHTPVWGGNFIFRAVWVRAGLNRVSFSYHRLGHPWLTLLSWATLALVAGWSIDRWRRRRKRAGLPAPG